VVLHTTFQFKKAIFGITGVWTQGLSPGRQMPYYLSNTPSSFCLRYFSYKFSWVSPSQPEPQSSYLCLLHSWDGRHTPPCPALLIEMGSCKLFA
jgi:hypothetical protein